MQDQTASAEATHDTVFATGDIAPAALVLDEVEEAEDQWLTDELLERVFG